MPVWNLRIKFLTHELEEMQDGIDVTVEVRGILNW
jgi:hypothetical protein